jgi:hypothetical protein
VGRLAEAVAIAQEALSILRDLVTTERAAFLSDLAGVVTNLATLCAEDGDLAQARTLAAEAAGYVRELARANPGVFDADVVEAEQRVADLAGT